MVFKCFYNNEVYKDLFNSYDKRNPKEKTHKRKRKLSPLTLCLYFKIGLVKIIMIVIILLANIVPTLYYS